MTRTPPGTPNPAMQQIVGEILDRFQEGRSLLTMKLKADETRARREEPFAICSKEAKIVESNFGYFDETYEIVAKSEKDLFRVAGGS